VVIKHTNTVKRTRKKNWTDPEIFVTVHTVLDTNDKDLWRCVKGNLVTKVTPQESIDL
jgi:hypothetical protein